ncbi:protein PYRICULARIA ORYZAE RESISTANCE 21-like isoform X2 [Cucurbita pepo subsp. pepo]|uniref:protein PYRICULARIA ORYZAE RESISTANCE 21-like isoform X2 n=1 Tax=Cucurbita pepo subsp. pepo TaxID=3664 RepID=UPI000C9D2D39|nr:protein PYRICULARIA ORYZAE RESISTANCE 21-like isoform X2 [Cucurbita pepo subsp. pepo]
MADAKKVVLMMLKVDLQCHRCYKKVKKVLCKFPQIRDQIYDEKQNLVIIKVVCCNPEKLRDKICCKGCGVIKSIQIQDPEIPKPVDPPPPQTVDPPPPQKVTDSPPPKKPDPPPPQKVIDPPPPKKPDPPPPQKVIDPPLPKKPDPPPPQKVVDPPAPPKKADPPPPAPPKKVDPPPVVVQNPPPVQAKPVPRNTCVPVAGYPPAYPMGVCCRECYEGRGGGPCYSGFGRPRSCCEGCASGRPIYDSYGGGRSCYISPCEYLNEENATGCSVM